MKIWITGIAGFLGSHVAEALLEQGHFIYGNDNLICGDIHNIAWNNLGLKYVVHGDDEDIDCRDQDAMFEAFNEYRPDVLIHCAATAHEGLSSFSPSFITKNIYEASVATFSAAIAAGVKRIIFMSSMARYGAQDLPFRESMRPIPVDPYGIAKVAAEDTLKVLCRTHGVEYVILVPHNIIGPRQKYDDPARNVASIMINRSLQGKPLIIYGDGKQKRCFSPIKDCLHSITKAVTAQIAGETINIGPESGHITILELARMIVRLTGNKMPFIHMPDRPNEVKEAWCANNRARLHLGYEAQQSLEDCLAEMVKYIKTNGVKPFNYFFPIEIKKGCPATWKDKLI